MTVDPGAYDATPADLALEREDDADERAVQARKDAMAGDYLAPGELTARARLYARNRTLEAVGRPTTVAWLTERNRARDAVVEAAMTLRAAETNGLDVDSAEWSRLIGVLRDRCETLRTVTP